MWVLDTVMVILEVWCEALRVSDKNIDAVPYYSEYLCPSPSPSLQWGDAEVVLVQVMLWLRFAYKLVHISTCIIYLLIALKYKHFCFAGA